MRMKQAEKAKEEAKNNKIEIINYNGADYQKKTKETNNSLLDSLW